VVSTVITINEAALRRLVDREFSVVPADPSDEPPPQQGTVGDARVRVDRKRADYPTEFERSRPGARFGWG
jgi:hypothetical protein